MSTPKNIEKVADRIAAAITKSMDQLKKAAEQYAAEMQTHGEDLERALIARGFERFWLRLLQLVGGGQADIRLMHLSPEKQSLLLEVTLDQQQTLLRDGIDGHLISDVAVPVLRKYIRAVPDRYRQDLSDEFHWVSSHLRGPAKKRPPVKIVVVETGFRVGDHLLTWDAIVEALRDAVANRLLPPGKRASLRALFAPKRRKRSSPRTSSK